MFAVSQKLAAVICWHLNRMKIALCMLAVNGPRVVLRVDDLSSATQRK